MLSKLFFKATCSFVTISFKKFSLYVGLLLLQFYSFHLKVNKYQCKRKKIIINLILNCKQRDNKFVRVSTCCKRFTRVILLTSIRVRLFSTIISLKCVNIARLLRFKGEILIKIKITLDTKGD